MLVQDTRLTKRARILRHARHDSPNVLKARLPQLFGGFDDGDDDDDDETTVRTTTIPRTTATASTRAITTNPVTSNELSTTVPTSTLSNIVATPTTFTTPIVSTSTSSVLAISFISTPSISSATRITRTTSASSTISLLTSTSATSKISSQTTSLVTRTVSSRSSTVASSTGTASSSTASSTSSSGVSTAGIIGIAGASIVGAAVLVGIVMFFLRRWNRKEDEFDPDAFRRQSTVLRDDNSSLHRGNSNSRGPRPPTMFERHNQNVASFNVSNIPPSTGYGSSFHPYGAPSPYGDFAGSPPPMAFAPGMYVPASAASPAPTGQYANAPPFFNPAYQSHSSVGPYGVGYDAQSQVVRSPSNGASSVLTRNNSVALPQYSAEESDYADLNRTSVTPFQAAQYEAISKQLNIPPPMPLHQVAEAEEAEELPNPNEKALPISGSEPKLVSPFEDPAQNINNVEESNALGPVSEIHTTDHVQRVTSQPPSLPEFQMVTGSFSPVNMSFPVTASPREGSFDVQGGRASPKVDLPPLSPVPSSPQLARFVDGMEARAHDGHETPVEIGFVGDGTIASKGDVQPPAQTKNEDNKSQAVKRPETVYDVEDAYGGI